MSAPHGDGGWPDWWLRRTALSWALWPLSLLFGWLTASRRGLYRAGVLRARRLSAPVVVVGNLTVGGAGKTPLIAALAQGLQATGWHPGIVSRGYGREATAAALVDVRADGDPRQCGDEPVLLARMTGCPVMVGRRRAAAAHALLAAHPEVDIVLSDDGLQHLALARDLELAVVDQRLWGNGWLLPAGPLRETSGRRRDATLGPPVALRQLTDNAPRFVVQRAPGDIAHLTNGERLSVDAFRQRFAGQPLGAIAGIGHPGQFFAMLRTSGLSVQGVAVADHRSFPADALDAFPPGAPVLITEKDAIKSTHLPPALRERLWVVGLRLDLPAELLPWLTHQLEIARGRSTA